MDEVGRNSNLGSRSARPSTQRCVAEWSAEPGAEAAPIRRARGGAGPAVYDHLTRVSTRADRRYLEILKVTSDEGQTVLEHALVLLLAVPNPVISAAEVLGLIGTWRDVQRQWRERPPLEVCLADYDAQLDGWNHRQVLRHLCESEAVERGQNRTVRLLSESGLPETKTLSTLDETLLSTP